MHDVDHAVCTDLVELLNLRRLQDESRISKSEFYCSNGRTACPGCDRDPGRPLKTTNVKKITNDTTESKPESTIAPTRTTTIGMKTKVSSYRQYAGQQSPGLS